MKYVMDFFYNVLWYISERIECDIESGVEIERNRMGYFLGGFKYLFQKLTKSSGKDINWRASFWGKCISEYIILLLYFLKVMFLGSVVILKIIFVHQCILNYMSDILYLILAYNLCYSIDVIELFIFLIKYNNYLLNNYYILLFIFCMLFLYVLSYKILIKLRFWILIIKSYFQKDDKKDEAFVNNRLLLFMVLLIILYSIMFEYDIWLLYIDVIWKNNIIICESTYEFIVDESIINFMKYVTTKFIMFLISTLCGVLMSYLYFIFEHEINLRLKKYVAFLYKKWLWLWIVLLIILYSIMFEYDIWLFYIDVIWKNSIIIREPTYEFTVDESIINFMKDKTANFIMFLIFFLLWWVLTSYLHFIFEHKIKLRLKKYVAFLYKKWLWLWIVLLIILYLIMFESGILLYYIIFIWTCIVRIYSFILTYRDIIYSFILFFFNFILNTLVLWIYLLIVYIKIYRIIDRIKAYLRKKKDFLRLIIYYLKILLAFVNKWLLLFIVLLVILYSIMFEYDIWLFYTKVIWIHSIIIFDHLYSIFENIILYFYVLFVLFKYILFLILVKLMLSLKYIYVLVQYLILVAYVTYWERNY